MAPPSVLDRRDQKTSPDSTNLDSSKRDRKTADDKSPREVERPGQRRTTTDKDQSIADKDRLTPTQALTPEIVKAIKNVSQSRIESLAGKTVQAPGQVRPDYSLYQQQMISGEDALVAGRYFEAEDRFGRAIAAAPGEPMARIGRVHAQLGAGLYLSAAANLRKVFVDHPELIGATYAQSLIPNNDRAEHITQQLRTDLTKDISALNKEAAFLMAYLGHVRGDAQLCREGLIEMAKRADMTDPAEAALFDAVRSAWAQ